MSRLTGAPLIVASVQAGPPPRLPSLGAAPGAFGELDGDLVADCSEAVGRLAHEFTLEGVPANCRKLESTSAARALPRTS